MEITADQLIQLIETIRREHGQERRMQMHPPTEEEFIAEVLREEYGVTGVGRPQTYDVVVREYLPVEWQARPGAPTIGVGRDGAARPAYQSQILADLDTLRRSPLAALFYIIGRAAGYDNATSMNLARFAQAVAALIPVAAPRAYSRSISSTTGRPQETHTPRVAPPMPRSRDTAWAQQQLYQQDLQRRGHSDRPAAAGRPMPQPIPRLRR